MSNEKKNNNEEIVFETPFDVLELPSKGLLYPGKPSTVKVEYLTAADENVLTSPNLIRSGKVLDVLIERKIKSKEIPMSSLLVGDRNAIMIWLRATGYGEMYPVKMTDPTTFEEFETEIDLTTLKTISFVTFSILDKGSMYSLFSYHQTHSLQSLISSY